MNKNKKDSLDNKQKEISPMKFAFKRVAIIVFALVAVCVGWIAYTTTVDKPEPNPNNPPTVVKGDIESLGELEYDDFGMPLVPEGVEREGWMVDYFGRNIYDGLSKQEASDLFWKLKEENAGKEDKNGLTYEEMKWWSIYRLENKFEHMLSDDTYLDNDPNDLEFGLPGPWMMLCDRTDGPQGDEFEEMFNDLFEAIGEEAVDWTDEWMERINLNKNDYKYVKGMRSKTTNILVIDFHSKEQGVEFVKEWFESEAFENLPAGIYSMEYPHSFYLIEAPNAIIIANRIEFHYAELKPEYQALPEE